MISNFSEQGENRMAYPTKIKPAPDNGGFTTPKRNILASKMSIHDLIRPS